jgi:hypothetical protein
MADIARRDVFLPAPVTRATRKQLNTIEQQAVIIRAVTEAEEQAAALRVDRRIENGYLLAGRTTGHAGMLNRQITETCRDNPGLEIGLRNIETVVSFAAQSLIYQYMTR